MPTTELGPDAPDSACVNPMKLPTSPSTPAASPVRARRAARTIAAVASLPLLIALGPMAACGQGDPPPTSDPPEDESIPQVESPPANGPQLVALQPNVAVRERPSTAGRVLGHLRAGGRVARSAEPYSKRGCPGGWYVVRPKGFVCVGEEASLDLESPLAVSLASGPDTSRALPYRYARVRRGDSAVYRKLPTEADQAAAEPDVRKHKPLDPKRLGVGANDVPIDDQGMPSGPPVLLPTGEGVGADGYRTTESYFVFPGAETVPVGFGAALRAAGDDVQVLRRDSGVALVRAFAVGEGPAARRFGLMPDGRFIPIDRLVPTPGSAWHGVRIDDAGLPVAFALRTGVVTWKLDKDDKATPLDEEFAPREAIALTGRFRTVNSLMYYCLKGDGPEQWVRAKDIILVPKRHKFPDFAGEGQKWLDVSLANQTLTAFVGHKPVYATLISSGSDRLGDPAQGPATIQGVFRLRSKYLTRDVDPKETGELFTVTDVPWVAEFAEGFALTGSYWIDDFGEAASYHNVAMAPVDARWVWTWSDPPIPEGWNGAVIDEQTPTTIVYVHR